MNEPDVLYLPHESKGSTRVFKLIGPKDSIKLKIARQGNAVQYRGDGVYELNGKGIKWKRDKKYVLKDYLWDRIGATFSLTRGKWFEKLLNDIEIKVPDRITYDETDGELSLEIEGELDVYTVVKRRKEQAKLRSELFKSATTKSCSICGHEMPVDFLITSHIKMRSKATRDERLDKNIVLPMCNFGCDALFEKGIIGVIGGQIVRIKRDPITPHFDLIVKNLIGRPHNENPLTHKYFDWHFDFHNQKYNANA